ncbi:MAG: hypothetical protein JNM24_11450 [Bdellovibrionaceae bacterium]|nr:hypothetical protein [Pseudobdellovibrionaceae bacterium]
MNTIIDKEEKKTEMHTALGIIEDEVARSKQSTNEEVPISIRRGRNGSAQTALGLDQRNNKAPSTNANEVFRVVISKESNDSLEVALSRCSNGFDSGTITKSDVANYVFQNLAKFFSDSDVKSLRATHFDEKKVLGSILRNDDDLPEELRKAIRAHFGIAAHERDRKRSSKQNDNV